MIFPSCSATTQKNDRCENIVESTCTGISADGKSGWNLCLFARVVKASKQILPHTSASAGVELSRVLTARKLLIPGTATTAKKAPLPNPLYVYCTKMLFALESSGRTYRQQYSTGSPRWLRKMCFSDPISVNRTRSVTWEKADRSSRRQRT